MGCCYVLHDQVFLKFVIWQVVGVDRRGWGGVNTERAHNEDC